MQFKTGLMVATILAIPALAQAQPVSGIYVGAGAGANFRAQTTAGQLTIGTETGIVGVGSVGYAFGNGFRAELEGNYRHNDVGTSRAGTFRGTSGALRTYGAMVNGFYDFNLASFGVPTITPYLGGGIGYGQNNWDRVSLSSGTGASFGTARSAGTNGNLAYQGIAGVAFGLGDFVPGLALTAEYRYYGVLHSTQRFNTNAFGATQINRSFSPTNDNHAALLGLRYTFNAPRPVVAAPAPVAPVQTVARTYLVFFDWNRADLTERARQVIAEAATSARTVRSTRIEVSGHADRTGPADYNQRLSVRRGEAVASELVRRGVARNEIVVQGFGYDRPLVPTAAGVREPQNRRVEIVLK
jgi:outer membrane protein OmpA-like peptidoglycan-associated protein